MTSTLSLLASNLAIANVPLTNGVFSINLSVNPSSDGDIAIMTTRYVDDLSQLTACRDSIRPLVTLICQEVNGTCQRSLSNHLIARVAMISRYTL